MKTGVVAGGAILASALVGAGWAIGSNSGDRIDVVRTETREDRAMSASQAGEPMTARSRKELGVWLLAMTVTAAALQSRRSRATGGSVHR